MQITLMGTPQILVLLMLTIQFLWSVASLRHQREYGDDQRWFIDLLTALVFVRLGIMLTLLQWGGFFTA